MYVMAGELENIRVVDADVGLIVSQKSRKIDEDTGAVMPKDAVPRRPGCGKVGSGKTGESFMI